MACVWCYRKFDRSENYRGVHRTVKSHTDEKYRKSYLRTRVRNDRKITLLMKEHPNKFGHTASWSCIAIVAANNMIVGLCLVVVPVVWHHPRECVATRAMKQQLPGLVASLQICTLLFWSLNQLNALRTHTVVADLQLQGQFDFVHCITAL